MSVYDEIAVIDIKNYLWDQIKTAGLLLESDYYADGFDVPLIPIIPSQQVPEFNNLLPGKTYIVYDFEVMPVNQNWWILHEVISLAVHSTSYDKINSILNFIVDLFRRYDNSATEVKSSNSISNTFIFHYTSIERVRSPEPTKNEGGIISGYVNILYCYSRATGESGRF